MFSKPSLLVTLGVSLFAAACSSPGAEPPRPAPKAAVTVTKAPEPGAATSADPIPAAVATAPAPAPVKEVLEASRLSVKRFVVASAIEDREPSTVESVELGQLPVFAFAELANGGDEEKVVITFEREGSSETVGHIELAVPAEMQRWRTWGKTNLISKPGRWSAVLRDGSGEELARTSFEVAPKS